MAKGKGKILFQESSQSNAYKPKILFNDEENISPKETTGWPGVAEDLVSKGIDVAKGIPGFISSLPGEIKGLASQHSPRLLKNLLAGAAESGHSTLSAPANLRDYLLKKHLVSEKSPSLRLPESILPKEYNYSEALGLGQHQRGDVLAQMIPGLLSGAGEYAAIRKIPGFRPSSRHQTNLSNALNDIENIKQEHLSYLAPEQEHAARASQHFLNFIEGKVNPETGRTEGGLRRKVGNQYDQLTKDLENENVQIAQTPDLNAISQSLKKLGKALTKEEKENLYKVMVHADSRLKTVRGSDALTTYREIKRQRSKASQKAYSPGIGPKEHEEWLSKSEELKDTENRMKQMLEKQIGGKYLERLKNIDKEYATQIAPLSENSMYQEMLKHGQTSKNIMKFLNGTTPGNKTLNAIVNNDPDLQRVIVGQKFASNPAKLVDESDLIERYKSLNPKISQIIQEQKNIQHAEKSTIPSLEEAIKKAEKKKLGRKGFRRGVGTTLAGIGAAYGLGRDYTKDLPIIAAIKTLLKKNK